MGANLGHQENFVAPALQAESHPFLAAMAIVFPRIVEEGYACVHRLLNQAHGRLDRSHSPKMISAKSDDRDLFASPSEGPARNLVRAGVRHFQRTCRACTGG